jgi:intein/homing endonuclease
MRCMCGCFTPDVVLDTTSGPKTILDLFESAKTDPFRLITQSEMFSAEYSVSPWLTRSAFTVGPEEKPVFKFTTDNGESITVTEKHPMVLNVDGEYELRLAREVREGDLFLAKDGTNRVVVSIESYMLPKDNNLVYNVNTKGERVLDHVITANGILVGDLYLQNFLNERAQKVENIQISE